MANMIPCGGKKPSAKKTKEQTGKMQPQGTDGMGNKGYALNTKYDKNRKY